MTPEVLLLGSALGGGGWLVVSALLPAPRPTLAERVSPYLLDISAGAREIHYRTQQNPLVILGIVLSPMMRVMATAVDAVLGGRESQRIIFQHSGRVEMFEDYRILRVVYAVGAGIAGLLVLAGVALVWGAPLVALTLGGGLFGVILMLTGGDWQLRREASRRSERIAEEFPTLLELLGLSLAAGDSLPRALARVSRRARGELGREWARVMEEVDQGVMLADSLRDSARRLGSPPVVAFVEHLAQALDRGAPLGEVIQAHGSDAHADYSRSLVERAGKAEVQMLVPMVLLILPITVIFAVYPGLRALEFGF
jgi:tight adherence protein C